MRGTRSIAKRNRSPGSRNPRPPRARTVPLVRVLLAEDPVRPGVDLLQGGVEGELPDGELAGGDPEVLLDVREFSHPRALFGDSEACEEGLDVGEGGLGPRVLENRDPRAMNGGQCAREFGRREPELLAAQPL